MQAFWGVVACLAAFTGLAASQLFLGHPHEGFFGPRVTDDASDGSQYCEPGAFNESYIEQPLDHFNLSETRTWQEYYQSNLGYYQENSTLVFLMLGGESAISARWTCFPGYQYLVWAKKYNAAVFQVEHRFFGNSRPFETFSEEGLPWFEPLQVLADYANFISTINNNVFPNKTMRWVLFGGSYPGTLVAWMRQRYPSLSIGGVASSAGVKLTVDYYGYADNMQKNYGRQSAECASSIAEGFTSLQNLALSTEGREALQDNFTLCDNFVNSTSIMPRDLQNFWGNVFSCFQGINQYSGDNRDNVTVVNRVGIPGACEILTNSSLGTPLERVITVSNWYFGVYGVPCLDVSYENTIAGLQNTSYDSPNAADRGWLYMNCRYLGLFQTTDGGLSAGIFGSLLPLDFYINMCIEVFGPQYTLDYTLSQVAYYRQMLTDPLWINVTNVVLPNGDTDPWFSIGYGVNSTDPARNVYAYTIEGGAHCSDMYPTSNLDSSSVTSVRQKIEQHIDAFVTQSASNNTTTTTTAAITTTTAKGAGNALSPWSIVCVCSGLLMLVGGEAGFPRY